MTTSFPAAAGAPAPQRLMSLDALRGFDMFWILGADSLVYALNRMSQTGPTKFLAYQLEHAEWQGFRFYDLIFPLFVFMVGASIVFSLTKTIAGSSRREAVKRVVIRGALLFLIGIFYSGGFTNPWPDMRLMGVLNRIALAYLGAGLLFIYFKPRALAGICAGLLVGYWALMTFVPIRDIQLEKNNLAALAEQAGDSPLARQFREAGNVSAINPSSIKDSPVWAATERMYLATTNRTTGKFDMGYNVACHLDFKHLPGKKWDLFWDPEGILSTLPAIATCLLGVFAGLLLMGDAPKLPKIIPIFAAISAAVASFANPLSAFAVLFAWGGESGWAKLWIVFQGLAACALVAWLLLSGSTGEGRKVKLLIGFGIVAVLLGNLWGFQFPVIKKIWTSSYVLVAGGYSAILMGVFYLVVDVWKMRAWCQPFVWIGMNSITIYLTKNFLGGSFNRLSARLVGGDISSWLNAHVAKGCGDLAVAIVGLLLAFWFVRFLYKRQIFLRL